MPNIMFCTTRKLKGIQHTQERLHVGEWGAVLMSVAGTVGLGASAEDEVPGAEGSRISKWRIFAVVLPVMLLLVLSSVIGRRSALSQRGRRGPSRPPASVYGLQVNTSCN